LDLSRPLTPDRAPAGNKKTSSSSGIPILIAAGPEAAPPPRGGAPQLRIRGSVRPLIGPSLARLADAVTRNLLHSSDNASSCIFWGTTISCRLSAYSCWRRFWDLDQLPSASEQLPAAPTIVREELYGADISRFPPANEPERAAIQ